MLDLGAFSRSAGALTALNCERGAMVRLCLMRWHVRVLAVSRARPWELFFPLHSGPWRSCFVDRVGTLLGTVGWVGGTCLEKDPRGARGKEPACITRSTVDAGHMLAYIFFWGRRSPPWQRLRLGILSVSNGFEYYYMPFTQYLYVVLSATLYPPRMGRQEHREVRTADVALQGRYCCLHNESLNAQDRLIQQSHDTCCAAGKTTPVPEEVHARQWPSPAIPPPPHQGA